MDSQLVAFAAAGDALHGQCRVVRSLTYLLFRRSRRNFRGHVAAERHHRVHGHFRFMETATPHERIFPVVYLALHGRIRFLHFYRPFHHVHVLRGGSHSDVPAHRCMGQRA